MKMVIDMPKELYDYLKAGEYDEHLDKRLDYVLRFAVKDGIPLPEHYGRLGDLDALEDEFSMLEKVTNADTDADRRIHEQVMDCWGMIMKAPTITPAMEGAEQCR